MMSKAGLGQRPVTFPSPMIPKKNRWVEEHRVDTHPAAGDVACKILIPGKWNIDKKIGIEISEPALLSIHD
jgi:hypothetical protein